MKLFSIKYMLLTVGAALLAACSSDGEVRDLQVTAVQSFYEPADAKSVVLQSSS